MDRFGVHRLDVAPQLAQHRALEAALLAHEPVGAVDLHSATHSALFVQGGP